MTTPLGLDGMLLEYLVSTYKKPIADMCICIFHGYLMVPGPYYSSVMLTMAESYIIFVYGVIVKM